MKQPPEQRPTEMNSFSLLLFTPSYSVAFGNLNRQFYSSTCWQNPHPVECIAVDLIQFDYLDEIVGEMLSPIFEWTRLIHMLILLVILWATNWIQCAIQGNFLVLKHKENERIKSTHTHTQHLTGGNKKLTWFQ